MLDPLSTLTGAGTVGAICAWLLKENSDMRRTLVTMVKEVTASNQVLVSALDGLKRVIEDRNLAEIRELAKLELEQLRRDRPARSGYDRDTGKG